MSPIAYSTPLTAVSSATLTAAQWNASVRDNILETPAAKATTAGSLFVTAGSNSIAERAVARAVVATNQTTASTSYTALATVGPAVTVTTGSQAIVMLSARMSQSLGTAQCWAAVAVSGATTIAATDADALHFQSDSANQKMRATTAYLQTGLTPGSNTFTMQYKVGSDTGTYQDRSLTVIAL